eukprot:TRINITY_DN11411_c1_g1_i1.p1 TRINITY_DN11411_c1_g1~~TRINITY_DN11411_c1_g1_i1.p1  ORF type:complete len:1183 (+),score=184.34 TRINITY_DN11411_c1_g1_i1:77-3625(+)
MFDGADDKRQPLLSPEARRPFVDENDSNAGTSTNAASASGGAGAVTGTSEETKSPRTSGRAERWRRGGAASSSTGTDRVGRGISPTAATARGSSPFSAGARGVSPGPAEGARSGSKKNANMQAAISELRAASATMARSHAILTSPVGSAGGSPTAGAFAPSSPGSGVSSPTDTRSGPTFSVGDAGFGAAVTATAGALRREPHRVQATQEYYLGSGATPPRSPSPCSPWKADISGDGVGPAERRAQAEDAAGNALTAVVVEGGNAGNNEGAESGTGGGPSGRGTVSNAASSLSVPSGRSADAAAGAVDADAEAPRASLNTESEGGADIEVDEPLNTVSESRRLATRHQMNIVPRSSESSVLGPPDGNSPRLSTYGDADDVDIVQMTSEVYFVADNEGKVNLDVMRLGALRGSCKVKYRSVDCTATAGDAFGGVSGTITFREGEHTKQIKIVIYSDDIWTGTQEFKIELSDPQNCHLGKYLYFARVQIMDTATFPSNTHRDAILGGPETMRKVSGLSFFRDYCSMVLQDRRTKMRCGLVLLMSQAEGLYVALTLYINIYIVDVVLKQEEENIPELLLHDGPYDGRAHTAVLVGVLYFAPMLICHTFAYISASIDLGGQIRESLQKGLFRTYLDYSAGSREKVTSSDVQVGILQNCAEAAEGFMLFMEVISLTMKLMILTYFVSLESPNALEVAAAMPVLMIIWIVLRVSVLERRNKETKRMTAHVMRFVTSVCEHFQLIAGFRQRPQVCEMLNEHLEESGTATLNLEITELNNKYFSMWLGPFFTGVYMALYAPKVLSGGLELGVFLATVRIFKELSEVFTEIYEALVKTSTSIGSLKSLMVLFNMPTDLKQKQHNLRKIREMSRMERLKAFADNEEKGQQRPLKYKPSGTKQRVFRTDLIDFKMLGVSFKYTSGARGTVVLNNVSVMWPQGSLVAVVGSHGTGKGTLLDIIGGRLFPSQGEVFAPAHLRLLLIGAEPVIMSMSLWKNLTFGRAEASPRRVWEILDGLNAMKSLHILWEELQENKKQGEEVADLAKAAGFIKEHDDRASQGSLSDDDADVDFFETEAEHKRNGWSATMSASELNKLHLARALIVNAEVLVLHRPFHKYDESTVQCVMGALQEHIRNRGYKVPTQDVLERRPRTIVFTPSQKHQAVQADIIWRLRNKTVEEISPEKLLVSRVSIA